MRHTAPVHTFCRRENHVTIAHTGMGEFKSVRPEVGRPLRLEELSLDDLAAIRILLRGDSIIDWHKLVFHDHAAVDRFLRVNEYNPASPDEMARLEELRMESVDYLNRVFRLPIPDEVAFEVPARDLFLIASRSGKHRRWACVVLKLIHICNHLAGRETMTSLTVADDAVFRATELKVIQVVEELRAAGYPITEFEWSRKQRDSLITKLLAKTSTQAAQIYDKLRFRLTVPNYSDLMPMLAMLTRQLIPFNYVVPGESINHLISFDTTLTDSQSLSSIRPQLQPDDVEQLNPDEDKTSEPGLNEFSGPDYKIINFIADLPLRVESLVPAAEITRGRSHIVFMLAEFQITDKATALRNEQGESSHDQYRARKQRKVRARLMHVDPGEDSLLHDKGAR